MAPAAIGVNWSSDPHAMEDREYLSMVAQSTNIDSPAPGRVRTKISDRRLIEYCCSEDSLLGREKYQVRGCAVFRMTIHHDLTTKSGVEHALQAVHDAGPAEHVHLWGSLPCTGGSPWQRVNAKYPSAREKIREHIATFEKLIKGFRMVAREVFKKGGEVSFEWPTNCALWESKQVTDMLEEMSMNRVNIHGCGAGLVSTKGVPVKSHGRSRRRHLPWLRSSRSSSVPELRYTRCTRRVRDRRLSARSSTRRR